MKKPKIHHPHDSLFKKAFQEKEVAIDFLKNRLPAKVLASIDLATLRVEETTFIANHLRASYSDLVLSVNIKGERGYIYTLVELQTQNDNIIVLRLLEYNLGLIRKVIKGQRDKKFPTIINMVLYAGKEPYKGDRCIVEAFADPKLFIENLTKGFLIDLTRESETEILQDGKAALVQLALRQGVKRDFEQAKKSDVFIALINDSNYGEEVLYYIVDRSERKPVEVLEEMDKLDAKLKQKIMSGLQKELKESKKEGIQIGEQKGIQKGRQSTLKELVNKGYIGQSLADKILKEKTKV